MRESIAHYKIISQIGSGGMGQVFLAADERLGRNIALKVLDSEAAGDEDRIRRFIQEAKAASALNHPNILTVYEIGTFDDSHYIATELIKGHTLRHRLNSEPLTLQEVLDIAAQAAAALNAAHEAHIVHRDIKPENIMVRDDGFVKVLDFGLAKLAERPSLTSGSDDETRALVNTAPGMIMGTVNYMSPEQARGKTTDERTDIWSLGVVIYEMLAGRKPFSGETSSDTMAEILTKDPDALPETIPVELRRIVKKCLRKKAEERYQNVKDLLLDLKDLKRELEFPERSIYISGQTQQMNDNATAMFKGAVSGDTSSQKHISSREFVTSAIWHHKIGAAAVLALAAIVLGGFGYGMYKLVQKPTSGPPQTAAIKTERLTGDGKTYGARISPDGKFLLFLKLEGGQQSLWIKQIQTNSTVPIVKPGELSGISAMTFSPDGGFVYFNSAVQGEPPTVYRAPTLGGAAVKVLTNASLVEFSHDGSQISFYRSDLVKNDVAIFIANADGSNERRIASDLSMAPWSPDGKYLAVSYHNAALEPGPTRSISLVAVADGSRIELGTMRWSFIDDIVWHPSGDSLIVAARENPLVGAQLWEISYPSGTARRLTDRVSDYYTLSVTADGKSIVANERYSRSAVWVSPDLKPENAKPVMPDTGDTWGLSWTSDNRIVFVSDQTGSTEIWIMDADGGNAKPLTNDRVFKSLPVVSPDGRYIVYIAARNGRQMERIDIDGGNMMVYNNAVSPGGPDISADGKWVIYDSLSDTMSRIFRIPIGGGEPQQLIDSPAISPRYSMDGTKFACFMADPKTQYWTTLGVFNADGGQPLKTFNIPLGIEAARAPVWTPDDAGITLLVMQGQKINLFLQSVNGGEPKQISDFDRPLVYRRQYSRDGKRIALVRGENIGNAVMITGFR